jgi:hypothetical protein
MEAASAAPRSFHDALPSVRGLIVQSPALRAGSPRRTGYQVFHVDLRRDRFMKLWRVSGGRVDATAAIIRRGERFTAAVHYRYADGRSRSWSWRTREGTSLNGREVVRCITSIDRGFRAIPGVHVRIDFPQNASREEQMVILMDYGLFRLFEDMAPSVERELAEDVEFDLPDAGASSVPD